MSGIKRTIPEPKYKVGDKVVLRKWDEVKDFFTYDQKLSSNTTSYYHSYSQFTSGGYSITITGDCENTFDGETVFEISLISRKREYNCYDLKRVSFVDEGKVKKRKAIYSVAEELIVKADENKWAIKEINQYCQNQCVVKLCEEINSEKCILEKFKENV